jgi:hypothetical protein
MPENNAAQLILSMLTGTIIPVVVLWLQRVSWPSYFKFGLAACLSIIAATLMAYIEGKLDMSNMVQNFVTLFTISQTVYFTFFRALNLHQFMYPQDVLANLAKDRVSQSIEDSVDKETARNILDERKPEQLSVSVDVTSAQG